MQEELQNGLPPGSTTELHEAGWMTKEVFITWFKKCIMLTGVTKEKPVLLLLDGHSTHTKSLRVN